MTHIFKFAAVADLHFGSSLACIEELSKFVKLAYLQGVREILCAGDILDGDRVYPGQQYELSAIGADEQIALVISDLPREEDLTWHIIAGNHDDSFKKNAGFNACETLQSYAQANGRNDIIYHGQTRGMVRLGSKKQLAVEMLHPSGGVAMSSSLSLERFINATHPSKRPHIILQGHEHRLCSTYRNGIYAFKPGCFQKQSQYMVSKNLYPAIGGLILTVKFHDEHIVEVDSHWLEMGKV